MGAVH